MTTTATYDNGTPIPAIQLAHFRLHDDQKASVKYQATGAAIKDELAAFFATGVPKFTPEQNAAVLALLTMQAAACVRGNIGDHVYDALAVVSEGRYQPTRDDMRQSRPAPYMKLHNALEKFRSVAFKLSLKHGLEY